MPKFMMILTPIPQPVQCADFLLFMKPRAEKDVLEAVHRCMLWFCDVWSGDNKTCYGGPYIIEAMVLCYYYTGDERLIDFCNDYQEYLCKNDFFFKFVQIISYKRFGIQLQPYVRNRYYVKTSCVNIHLYGTGLLFKGDRKNNTATARKNNTPHRLSGFRYGIF